MISLPIMMSSLHLLSAFLRRKEHCERGFRAVLIATSHITFVVATKKQHIVNLAKPKAELEMSKVNLSLDWESGPISKITSLISWSRTLPNFPTSKLPIFFCALLERFQY